MFWRQHFGQQPRKDKHRKLMLIGETQEMEKGRKKPAHTHAETPKALTTRSGNEKGIQKPVCSHWAFGMTLPVGPTPAPGHKRGACPAARGDVSSARQVDPTWRHRPALQGSVSMAVGSRGDLSAPTSFMSGQTGGEWERRVCLCLRI